MDPVNDSARGAENATGSTRGAPPGWYQDPSNAAQVRYWNGSNWTQQMAPEPAGPPPAASFVPSTSPAATPVKGRGLAVGSGGSASQSEACQVELRTLRTAQQAFIAERGADPTSQQDLVTAGLLKSPSSNYDLDSGGGGAVWRPVAGGPCA